MWCEKCNDDFRYCSCNTEKAEQTVPSESSGSLSCNFCDETFDPNFSGSESAGLRFCCSACEEGYHKEYKLPIDYESPY